MKFESTIYSSPIRGKGGNARYRGNCAPGIIESFIDQYTMKYLSDYAMGSGTTKDVCINKGINGYWTDLHLGFDLMNCEIPDIPDNIFYHPAYWNMNRKIIYSETEYSWQEVKNKYGFDPRNSDLSQMPNWDSFVKALNYTVMKQFAAMANGGRMGILLGDIKTKGKLNSMLFDIVKPGTVEQVIIKTQHNCWSDKQLYAGNFIPTAHEYLLILRKDSPYTLDFQICRTIKLDMRDSDNATWKDVVASAISTLSGKANLTQIYREVEGHKKCSNNAHWKEKVRQTLQAYACFSNISRGDWELLHAA